MGNTLGQFMSKPKVDGSSPPQTLGPVANKSLSPPQTLGPLAPRVEEVEPNGQPVQSGLTVKKGGSRKKKIKRAKRNKTNKNKKYKKK